MKLNLGKIQDQDDINPQRLNRILADLEKALLRVPDVKEGDTIYLTKDNEIKGANVFTGGVVVKTLPLTLTGVAINHATAEVVAHATTMDIWSGSNHKTMTGSAKTVTDVADAPQAGSLRWVRANAAHIITHGGAITVQGGANFTCEDGDWMLWFAKTTSTFHVLLFPLDGNPITAPAVTASLPIGTICDYGGVSLPTGWLECDGAAVSRTVTYADLFTAIGVLWGVGNGSTTFNVPDLDRYTLIGRGGSQVKGPGIVVGNKGGSEEHALIEAELAAHTHTTQLVAASGSGFNGIDDATITNNASTGNQISSSTGSGTAHNNMQPSAVVMKIIKYL